MNKPVTRSRTRPRWSRSTTAASYPRTKPKSPPGSSIRFGKPPDREAGQGAAPCCPLFGGDNLGSSSNADENMHRGREVARGYRCGKFPKNLRPRNSEDSLEISHNDSP